MILLALPSSISTSACTLITRLRSVRRIVAGPRPTETSVAVANGISAPVGVRNRIPSRFPSERRSSRGKRTITLTSSRPRWMRCASSPKNACRTWRARSSWVRPAASASGVIWSSSSCLPTRNVSVMSMYAGVAAQLVLETWRLNALSESISRPESSMSIAAAELSSDEL